MEKQKMPTTTSVLLIIVSAFTVKLMAFFLILTLPAIFVMTPRSLVLSLMYLYNMPVFVVAEIVILGTDIINWITIIIAGMCLTAGILGIVYRKRPKRMKICINFGFAIMVLELIVLVVTLALFEMNLMRVIGWSLAFLIGLIVPGMYTYEAYKFKKRS